MEFIQSHKEFFVDSNGRGYTNQFHLKVEDFLTQLCGEDHRVLLVFKKSRKIDICFGLSPRRIV